MPRAPKLPPSKQMFSDCFDANGECKSPKALVQRRQEFIDAMSKSTYDGLTGRTYMEGESDDGTPLVKSRATVAAGLRESAVEADSPSRRTSLITTSHRAGTVRL